MFRTIAALLAATFLALTAQPANADHGNWHQGSEPRPATHHGVPAPAGDPSEWAWMGGTPEGTVRWDPCTPITWSAPADGSATEAAFSAAVRQVARFSGYTFQRVESGGLITSRTATGAEIAAVFPTGAVAYAGADAFPRPGSMVMWATRGYIVMWDKMLTAGWRSKLPALYLHELGHVMGLGHVPSAAEMMYQGGPPRDRRYGAGDRAGLAAVHAGLDCAPPPASARGGASAVHQVVAR